MPEATDTQQAMKQAVSPPFNTLPKRQRRLVILRAVGRTLLSVAILIGVFLIIPPDDLARGTAALSLGIAIVLILILVGWEIYRTVNDPYPEIRAITSLVVLSVAVVVTFALTYATLSAANPENFNEVLTKGTAIYFTVTTLSTTGFGDIHAMSGGARWVVTGQMLFDLLLVVGLAKVFLVAVKAGRVKQGRDPNFK